MRRQCRNAHKPQRKGPLPRSNALSHLADASCRLVGVAPVMRSWSPYTRAHPAPDYGLFLRLSDIEHFAKTVQHKIHKGPHLIRPLDGLGRRLARRQRRKDRKIDTRKGLFVSAKGARQYGLECPREIGNNIGRYLCHEIFWCRMLAFCQINQCICAMAWPRNCQAQVRNCLALCRDRLCERKIAAQLLVSRASLRFPA